MVGLTIIKNGIQWHFMEIPRELNWDYIGFNGDFMGIPTAFSPGLALGRFEGIRVYDSGYVSWNALRM